MQRPVSEQSGSASDIPSMYTPSQLRMLRIAVVAMGLVLLIGFAVVVGRIVYLLNVPPGDAAPGSDMATVAAPPAPTSIGLPKGAVVKHLAIAGNRLAIHYESPSGAGIRIVDLAAPARDVTLSIVEQPAP
jgi:hypothetical protein